MKDKKLLDTYRETGNSIEGFRAAITEISAATDVLYVKGSAIALLSVCDVQTYQTKGKTTFYMLNEACISDFVAFGERLNLGSFPSSDFDENLLNEMKENTGLLITADGQKLLVAKSTLTTLAQRACVSGDSTSKRHNIVRDLHLADALFDRDEWLSLVYRKGTSPEGRVTGKVFAALSNEFSLVRQDIILQALDHEGFPFPVFKTKQYTVDNFVTELVLYLPDVTSFPDTRPGLIIRNSDIGQSSFVVRNVVFVGDSYAIIGESSLRHDRSFSLEKIMDVFRRARNVYDSSEYEKLLETLRNADVRDYSCFDPTLLDDTEENYSDIQDILITQIHALYGSALSKSSRSLKRICLALNDAIDGRKKYTKYDLAKLLLTAPDTLEGYDEASLVTLRKAAADIPKTLST